LIQSVYAYLRLALSRTSKLAVIFISKLKSLLSRSKPLLTKLSLLVERFKVSGRNLAVSLALVPSLKLFSLFQKLKNLTMLLLTKLKSKLTSLKTSLSSSNFKNSWKHILEKKKKSLKQFTTQIKTTWRRHSNE
jgi:hypothetical protein